MSATAISWDYLVLTASNEAQARAYEMQLHLRQQHGLLPQVRETLVVPDLEGKRIGSGGSTLLCLLRILDRERRRRGAGQSRSAADILRTLRILIVHAGGDSRRLTAYGPCGKIFVPLPGHSDAPLPPSLYDRLMPEFLALPAGLPGRGQVVVAAGDALIRFDASQVSFSRPGLTALGCYASPEEASRHGVFCLGDDGAVSLYLQKPAVAEQRSRGVVNASGQTALDVAVMSFDAEAAESLLFAFGVVETAGGAVDFPAEARCRLLADGVDLYREVCCALGSAATREHYVRSARSSGSSWTEQALAEAFPALRKIPLYAHLVPSCRFLHFGSTRQLIESGLALVAEDQGQIPAKTVLEVNCRLKKQAQVNGAESWIEACRIDSTVNFQGHNVVVGVDSDAPLSLPEGACLEVLAGRGRTGKDVWFVRCYGVRDTFKHTVSENATFCGRPLLEWLRAAGTAASDIWPDAMDPATRSLWNARVFPAEAAAGSYRHWLWMYAPESASQQELYAFRAADRYSAMEIALLTDLKAFHARRLEIWRSK